jgi:hypothetical protein
LILLLNLLKAFGIDIPARFAEAKAHVERQVEDAADQAKHVVQDAVVTAALVSCAVVTAVAALAFGLVALALWVADYYGPFTALVVVGGILVLAAVVLAAAAAGRQQ